MSMNTIFWGNDMSDSNISAVSVSAQNAHGYLLSAGGDIHAFNTAHNWSSIWLPYTAPTVFVSAGYDGSILAISDTNHAYMQNQIGWSTLSASATCGAIGDNTSYVVCENDFSMKMVTYGSESLVFTPTELKQITTTVGNSHVWALDASGNVHTYNGSSWSTIGTKQFTRIHVSLSASNSLQACGVDGSGSGWVYDFTSSNWTSVTSPVTGVHFISLEAGNNYIWATLSNGQIYRGSF